MNDADGAGPDPAAAFPDEVVTNALARDVALRGVGTFVLVTLDNGLDHTKPNTFGPRTLRGLRSVLDQLAERAAAGEIVGVGVTGKPFIFAAGADLKGMARLTRREDGVAIARLGHATFAAFADLPVPTFAFINGVALGGGLELPLHAAYRTVCSSVTALALPETFLGLFPGWGGCYLLPRLIGVDKALRVIVENPLANNRMLTGQQAGELGIADAVFGPATFLEDSLRWAAEVISGRVPVDRPAVPGLDDTAEGAALWEGTVKAARKVVLQRTAGTSPGVLRALDLIGAARSSTREAAYAAEDEGLADVLMTDELRAGLYAFDLVQRRAKRPAGAPGQQLARPVTKVGIVGAGLMARQLALLFARRLLVPVVMADVDRARVDTGLAHIHAEIDALSAKNALTRDAANRLTALVTGVSTGDGEGAGAPEGRGLAAFADADLVVEAVFEDLAVKQQVFRQLESVVRPDCLLATNTSSLSVGAMAEGLRHPQRLLGLHFFNPVAVMPLLEIVAAPSTDEVSLATGFAVGKALKKTCIRVQDSPSFVVNRILGRMTSEVGRAVDEGTPIPVADAAFGGLAPMPPFVLFGLVGPAIALHNVESLAAAFPQRFTVPQCLRAVVDAGKAGFYTWPDGRPALDPDVVDLLPAGSSQPLRADEIRTRVLAALAEEARLMLDEGVVDAPQDLDLALIAGAGFSFWNGGLTPLLDRTGLAEQVTGRRFLPPGVASIPA